MWVERLSLLLGCLGFECFFIYIHASYNMLRIMNQFNEYAYILSLNFGPALLQKIL